MSARHVNGASGPASGTTVADTQLQCIAKGYCAPERGGVEHVRTISGEKRGRGRVCVVHAQLISQCHDESLRSVVRRRSVRKGPEIAIDPYQFSFLVCSDDAI